MDGSVLHFSSVVNNRQNIHELLAALQSHRSILLRILVWNLRFDEFPQ